MCTLYITTIIHQQSVSFPQCFQQNGIELQDLSRFSSNTLNGISSSASTAVYRYDLIDPLAKAIPVYMDNYDTNINVTILILLMIEYSV